jgi:hypothetical protein
MRGAVSQLSAEVKTHVYAGALFGDTRRSKGGIPGFDNSLVDEFCVASDGVCGGMPLVTAGHLVYGSDGSIQRAARFMADKAKAAKGSSRTNLQLVDGYSGGGLLGGSEGGSNRLRGGLFGGLGKSKSKSWLFKRQDAATGKKSRGSDTTAAKSKSKLNGPTGGADGTDANTPTGERARQG